MQRRVPGRIALSVLSAFVLSAFVLSLPRSACGQDAYPNRPIRMIVPFAAGGAADVVARLTAQAMADTLGQPVVVENRGGSGGVIGSEAVLAAPADGYTVAFHTLSSAVLNAGLYRNLSFDVRRAFAPVALIGLVPNVVLVNARVPAASLAELAALLKRNRDAGATPPPAPARSPTSPPTCCWRGWARKPSTCPIVALGRRWPT
jgi:tripartite-type tricarboxylate transporter receptor subunit TctC